MKRDMELMREILFKIEEQFPAGSQEMCGVTIDGYDMASVADHCQLLYEWGLINSYNPIRAGIDNAVQLYWIGNLTNKGYDFLDKIREDTVWNKTKDIIKKKGLPMVVDVIKDVATGIIQAMVQGAMKGLNG